MRDTDLYEQLLGLRAPWHVEDVSVDRKRGWVTVRVEASPDTQWACPTCGQAAPGYDRRIRRWRHLDTMQYYTVLEASVPRVRCAEHGVLTVEVPWAEPDSGFTALFEALVIDWLQEANVSAVSRLLGLSWGAVDRIMQRAVARGLARREAVSPAHLSVDETSFQKRHEYVTVVTDTQAGRVLYVADERRRASLSGFYDSLSEEQLAGIRSVSMDMWPGFIGATLAAVPGAARKIAFDKFHVAKSLGDGVDKVRRQEHKALLREGDTRLTRSRYQWLQNPAHMSDAQREHFALLRDSRLKTARAWAMKEEAMGLWEYRSRAWAEKGWTTWLAWAQRCRLAPMIKVGQTLRRYLWGILNATVLGVHNGHAESMNSRIQRIKRQACGFRNRERFRNAIYFHCGGLDMYPETLRI